MYISDSIQTKWEFSIQLKTKTNDILPITGIVVDDDGNPTKRIKPITLTKACKLRTDAVVTVDIHFPPMEQENIYNAGTVPYNGGGPVLLDTFDVITKNISKFTISTRMGMDQPPGNVGGKIIILYYADLACDPELCEEFEIHAGEKFDKIFIPTRRYYAIFYQPLPQLDGGADTTDFDFVVIKYPVPT
jgi:hypothetical protein